MKLVGILNRYILAELFGPFIVCVLFLTFIFLMKLILEITNFIVNYGVGIGAVIRMLMYNIPYFLQFIMPMSVMMAILLTFLRFSTDNEVVALKSCGFSSYRFLPPVMVFCGMGCILTGLMTIYGLPWGKLSLKRLTYEIVISHMDIGIKERAFNDSFTDVMLYVNKIDLKKRRFRDVFIEDQRNKDIAITIVAPIAHMYSDPENLTFRIHLQNGTIHRINLNDKTMQHSGRFKTYDLNLDLKRSLPGYASTEQPPKGKEEMSLSELTSYLSQKESDKDEKYWAALLKFHEKFSLPAACFALGLLGLPLGLQSRSDKRSTGVLLSLFLFLIYYILLLVGWSLGETGDYPPVIGMWIPNVIMGGLGIFLIIRVANDRPVQLDIMIRLKMMLRRFSRRSV